MIEPKIDPLKLTPEQRDKLDSYRQSENQIKSLQTIADTLEKIVKILNYSGAKGEKATSDIGSLLIDIRESLDEVSSKEYPETPDYAEPVVKTLVKLEKSLTKALGGLDLSPNISVNAPDVKVDSKVDLKGVEKILKTDLPKALDKAISNIPKVDIPKDDYTPLISELKNLSEKLESIDTGVRLKPAGVNAKITNSTSNPVPVDITDASVVITESAPTTLVAFRTTVTTAGTRVQLATNTVVAGILQAPSTNTGLIYVGGSGVSSTVFGAELQPGQACGIAISNTDKIYVDASVSGDKVAFLGSAA